MQTRRVSPYCVSSVVLLCVLDCLHQDNECLGVPFSRVTPGSPYRTPVTCVSNTPTPLGLSLPGHPTPKITSRPVMSSSKGFPSRLTKWISSLDLRTPRWNTESPPVTLYRRIRYVPHPQSPHSDQPTYICRVFLRQWSSTDGSWSIDLPYTTL